MPERRSRQHQALGQAIRSRREAAGLSQEAFAASAGLDRTHYSAIERGERNPSYAVLLSISEMFGIEFSVLELEAEALRSS